MIYDPRVRDEASDSVVAAYIREGITSVLGEQLALDPGHVDELAHAVASFVNDNGQDVGLPAVDTPYLLMLASRALSSVGDTEAARRLLVFGTGLVRPSEWEVTGEQAIWALDLRQMTVQDVPFIEILFFNSLNLVVESMAEVWDESQGRGVLGLRHVCSTAEALLGSVGKERAIRVLADEIKERCVGKLGQIGRLRKWEYVPVVMNLDG